MTNYELIQISGGAFSWGSIVNAVSRGINTLLDAGRTFGTSIRMIVTGKRC